MDSLDLLKDNWKKEDGFPMVNKREVSRLIRKRSKSIVRWIILVCIIELCLGIYFHIDFINGEGNKLSMVELIVKYLAYLLFIITTANIIRGYFRIRNDYNVESLMKNILYVKRYSTLFVFLNVIYLIISLILHLVFGDMYQAYSMGYIEGGGDPQDAVVNSPILILITFIVALGLIGVFYTLYYQLFYFRLVKKLEYNYKELVKG